MSAKKSEVLWMVWSPRFGLFLYTLARKRREAKNYCNDFDYDWTAHRKAGDRTVRVRVTVLDKVK